MKAAKKYREAMNLLNHFQAPFRELIPTLGRDQLASIIAAAKARDRILAKAENKQADAITKAGSMGARAHKFLTKHRVDTELVMGSKPVAKAAKAFGKKASKSETSPFPVRQAS